AHHCRMGIRGRPGHRIDGPARPLRAVEHLPAGTHNPDFLSQLAEAGVTAETQVVFLCRSGARSIAAAEAATAAGLGPAYNILDGFEGATDSAGHRGNAGWRAAGLPWKQS